MVDINWSLLQPANVGNAFSEGLETGRKRRQEEKTRSVLADIATNWPGSGGGALGGQAGIVADPQADEARFNELITPLAQLDPMMAIKMRQQFRNDQQGRYEAAQKRDEGLVKATGQAALDVLQLPPDQRAAKWDAYVEHFAQTNPAAAQYRGKYSDESAMALLAQAGMIKDYQASQQPRYMAIPEGGTLVNTRDTGAVAQFGSPQGATPQPQAAPQPGQTGAFMTPDQARAIAQGTDFLGWQKRFGTPVLVNSPEEAAKLPSGTIMVSTDGRRGVKR